jgi:hypothetical protein
MTMEKQFTTFQIAKALNLKYGRLREWLDGGYIKPSIYKAQRQGEKTLFTHADAYAIGLFDYLLRRGFSRNDAAIRIQALEMDDSLLSATYVAFYWQEGAGAYSVFIFEEKISLSLFGRTVDGKRGSFDDVLIVNFRKIREEIEQALT